MPPVPPLPQYCKAGKYRGAGAGTTPIAPVSVFPANAGRRLLAGFVGHLGVADGFADGRPESEWVPVPSPRGALTASLPPHRTPNGTSPSSPLNPATMTTGPPVAAAARTARALTLGSSSGSRIKESLAHLGVVRPRTHQVLTRRRRQDRRPCRPTRGTRPSSGGRTAPTRSRRAASRSRPAVSRRSSCSARAMLARSTSSGRRRRTSSSP